MNKQEVLLHESIAPITITKTEQVIDKLKSIKNGFIGKESKKPTSKSLRKVKRILHVLETGKMPFPSTMAMPNGSVILNWASLTRDIIMVVDNNGDVQFTTSMKKIHLETAEVMERTDSEGFITDMLSIDHIMVWFCSDLAYVA